MDAPPSDAADITSPPKPTKPPRRPLWRRRWLRVVLGCVIALVIVAGPWPAYEGDPDGAYARSTRARLDEMSLGSTVGPALAGLAAREITPPLGRPLGGYSARTPKACDALADTLWAKALSLSNGKQTVTIVAGDILLILPDLRDAILTRAGVRREEVYFTATHTHSGPGGFSPRWLEQISLGDYDEDIVETLADAFAEVITRSRSDMKPARIVVACAIPTARLVVNRMDETAPGNSSLACLNILGADGKHMGGLVTFNAHPTCLGHRSRAVSGDYPGMVQREMEQRFGGTWLFAAGAMGSMKPATGQRRGPKRLEEVARNVLAVAQPLAASALSVSDGSGQPVSEDYHTLPDKHLRDISSLYYVGPSRGEVTLACGVLAVDLPQTQYRISSGWRLSPIITSLIHARQSYLHVVRINAMVLLCIPGDYSGELSARLDWRVGAGGEAPLDNALIPVVTSFNGDYVGYLIPHERYVKDTYESRDANFFGPWSGEYFHDLSLRLIKRLAETGGQDDKR